MVRGRELDYDLNATALEMAQAIFGDGVAVVGASYTGDRRSSGLYGDGDELSPGVVPGDEGVILSTGRASSFTRSGGQANASARTSSNTSGPNDDPQFNDLAGARTFDASILDIDFVPEPGVESITIKFVFSSDEYPEFANSIYNDLVGVWSNGELVPLATAT